MARVQHLLIAILLVLLAAWTAHLCISVSATPAQYGKNPSSSWYAIGIDLTDSYGTASVRTQQGHAFPVTRIDGDEEYQSVMKRLGDDCSRHMTPPYEWWHDGGAVAGIQDLPRRLLREARKKIGLPASDDVGVISKMLSALHTQTIEVLLTMYEDDELIESSKSIVLSRPDLVALYDEDILDAAEHSGLQLLSTPWYERQPPHANTYFNAYGLASDLTAYQANYTNTTRAYAYVSAHLTQHALEVQCETRWTNRTCLPSSWAQHRGYFSAELGAALNEDRGLEWKKGVRTLVQRCVSREIQFVYHGGGMNVTDVLFGGESGGNEVFQKVVLDAMQEIQPHAEPVNVWPRRHQEAPVRNQRLSSFQQTTLKSELTQISMFEYGGSLGAANMAWEIEQGRLPEYITPNECWTACRWREDSSSDIRYC